MKALGIVLILTFSQFTFSMEDMGYPIGVIPCPGKIDSFKEVRKSYIESVSCSGIYGMNYENTYGERPVFAYNKKAMDKYQWCQVLTLSKGSRWIPIGNESIEDTALDKLSSIARAGLFKFNNHWDKKIYEGPNVKRFAEVKSIPPQVEIVESNSFDGELWVKINVYDGSKCIKKGEKLPKILHSGWIPFMKTNTESNFEKPFQCG